MAVMLGALCPVSRAPCLGYRRPHWGMSAFLGECGSGEGRTAPSPQERARAGPSEPTRRAASLLLCGPACHACPRGLRQKSLLPGFVSHASVGMKLLSGCSPSPIPRLLRRSLLTVLLHDVTSALHQFRLLLFGRLRTGSSLCVSNMAHTFLATPVLTTSMPPLLFSLSLPLSLSPCPLFSITLSLISLLPLSLFCSEFPISPHRCI